MAIYSPLARDIRNNGGAVLHGGATATTVNASFGTQPMSTKTSLLSNANVDREAQTINARLPQSITGSSGNVGTWRPNTNAVYNPRLTPRNSVIAKGLMGQFIAGTSGINFFAGAETIFRPTRGLNAFYGYQRLNITSWSYTTGQATYGSQRGVTVLSSGFDGVTGKNTDNAYPATWRGNGELTFQYGNYFPSAADYGLRTSS